MNFTENGVTTELLICPYCAEVRRDEITYFQTDYFGKVRLRQFRCVYGHLHFTQLPKEQDTPKRVAA